MINATRGKHLEDVGTNMQLSKLGPENMSGTITHSQALSSIFAMMKSRAGASLVFPGLPHLQFLQYAVCKNTASDQNLEEGKFSLGRGSHGD